MDDSKDQGRSRDWSAAHVLPGNCANLPEEPSLGIQGARMPRANKAISSKPDERNRGKPAQNAIRDPRVNEADEGHHRSYGKRMANGDRRQRLPDGGPLLFLQPERNREKPSHAGINAVESTQSGQRQPRPRFLHG